MDTAELKKKLAELKKQYKSKETVLKKVERRVQSKAHVKKRVAEEAKRHAEDEPLVSVRKPVKVKFEEEKEDATREYKVEGGKKEEEEVKTKQTDSKIATVNIPKQQQQIDGNVLHEIKQITASLNVESQSAIEDESQMILIDSEEPRLDEECSERLIGEALPNKQDDEKSKDCIDINITMDDVSVAKETVSKEKPLEKNNDRNNSLLTVKNSVNSESLFGKVDDDILPSSSTSKNSSPVTALSLKKLKSREAMMDFSYLDEDKNDLYSQIKKRTRRSKATPSPNTSLEQKPARKRKRSPKNTVSEPTTKDTSKVDSQKSLSIKIPCENNTPKSRSIKDIFDDSLNSLSSNSNSFPPEEYRLPSEIMIDTQPEGMIKSGEITSPLVVQSLPKDMKLHSEREGMFSPLLSPDFNSQLDFKSQKLSSRKSRVTRKAKPNKQRQRKMEKVSLAAGHSIQSKVLESEMDDSLKTSERAAAKSSQKEVEVTNVDYPFKSCGSFKTSEAVLHAECSDSGIVTCTSSTVTLWSERHGEWIEDFILTADKSTTFEGFKLVERDCFTGVIVASRNEMSYVFRLVPLKKGNIPVVLYEVPLVHSSQSSKQSRSVGRSGGRLLMCCLSASDLLITQPFLEHRQHTKLVSVTLNNSLDQVIACKDLPPLSSKLHSLVPVTRTPGRLKIAVGMSADSVYIWNVTRCSLLKEVTLSHKIVHCARIVQEQGLLFLACIADDDVSGGGGLFALNPATGIMLQVVKMEEAATLSKYKRRWQHMVWSGNLLCVSSAHSTLAVSTYTGHVVAHTSRIAKLNSMDVTQQRAVFANKNLVHVFNVCKPDIVE